MSAPRLSMAEKMRLQEAKRAAKDGGTAASKQDWKAEMQAAINLVNEHQQDTALDGDASAEILAETDKAVHQLFKEFKEAVMPALAIRMSQAISHAVEHNVADTVPEGTRSVVRPALAAALMDIPSMTGDVGFDKIEAAIQNGLKNAVKATASDLGGQIAEKAKLLAEQVEIKLEGSKKLIVVELDPKVAAKKMTHLKAMTYDEHAEREELKVVYGQLDAKFQLIDQCKRNQKAMVDWTATQRMENGTAEWKPDAASKLKPDDTVEEQIKANETMMAHADQQIVEIVTTFARRMKISGGQADKKESMNQHDLQQMKELKLGQTDQPMSNGKKMYEIMMTGMLKKPLEYAAILPALISFLRSNIAINTMLCPTFERMYDIEDKAAWPEQNWGMCSEATTQRVILETKHIADRFAQHLKEEMQIAQAPKHFGETDSERGMIQLQAYEHCGASYLEVWKHEQEWLSENQVEMYKMHVRDVFKMFYDKSRTLEDVLQEALRIVHTAIDFGAEDISWSQTGAMWANAVAANHAGLETAIVVGKLKTCPDTAMAKDCVTLLPDLLAQIQVIATEKQKMEEMPSIDGKHSMMMVTTRTSQQAATPAAASGEYAFAPYPGWKPGGRGGRGGNAPRGGGPRGGGRGNPRGGTPPKVYTWGHDSPAGKAIHAKLALSIEEAHHQCEIKGCPNVDLELADAQAFRAFAGNYKPPDSDPKQLPHACCKKHRLERQEGKVLQWKCGAKMTPVKKYSGNKQQTAAVVTVVSDQEELAQLRKQQEIGTQQLLNANSEIARLGQQTIHAWPPSAGAGWSGGGQPFMTVDHQQQMQQQQLYQQQLAQMAQQQHQGQMAAMQQQQPGMQEGVPGQTMVNIPPGPPSITNSQVAGFQQRPQPALMQLDADGNVVRGQ